MDEMIPRKAAIDAAIEAADIWDGGYSLERERIITERMEKVPAAQPERKKGKWIVDEKRFGHTERHCSLCGAILEGDDWKWRNNYYCYHCGADMRGEQDE